MSTIKVDTIQNTSGVEKYLASAWVNFNGTGTVAIRASGNVSSITDNGTGDYTVAFTNALADANYSVGGAANQDANGWGQVEIAGIGATLTNVSTTSVNIRTIGYSSYNDYGFVSVAIHR